MTPFGKAGYASARRLLAACCLIGIPVPDIQHENPPGVGKGRLLTQSGNQSSYKAVIEANESGRPAVEKLEPFHPGLLVIVLFAGVTSKALSVHPMCLCDWRFCGFDKCR